MTRNEKLLKLARKLSKLDDQSLEKVLEVTNACGIVQTIRQTNVENIPKVING